MATHPPIPPDTAAPPAAAAPREAHGAATFGYAAGAVLVVLLAAPLVEQIRERHREEARPVITLSPQPAGGEFTHVRLLRKMETTPVDLLFMDRIPQGECRVSVRWLDDAGRVIGWERTGACGSNSFRLELERGVSIGRHEAILTAGKGVEFYRYYFTTGY